MKNDNKMILLENSLIKNDYLVLLIFFITAVIITILIVGASYLLVKQNPESEKLSAYECGFEPYEDSRHTFDVRFCVVAILFVIFDIEIMFLIPWCVSVGNISLLGYWSMMDFLLELSVGFFYVWHVQALDWE